MAVATMALLIIIMPLVMIVVVVLLLRSNALPGHSRDEMEELYTRGSPRSKKMTKGERKMVKMLSRLGIDPDTIRFDGSNDEAEDDI